MVRWGNRRGESRALPCTGWTWQATVEEGRWAERGPELVVVPAALAVDNGLWFLVRQGVRGLAARDEAGEARVYVLCEPAGHYCPHALVSRCTKWLGARS
jgi:hypothetical protein